MALVTAVVWFVLHFVSVSTTAKDSGQDCEALGFQCKDVPTMLRWMNASAGPCKDFAEYACGGFYNMVREKRQESWNIRKDIMEPANEKAQNDIITDAPHPNDSVLLLDLKNAYAACRDIDSRDRNGRDNFLESRFAKLWPSVSRTWEPLPLNDLISLARQNYVHLLFQIVVIKTGTWKGNLRLDKTADLLAEHFEDLSCNSTEFQAFRTFYADVAEWLGAEREVAERDAMDVQRLITALLNVKRTIHIKGWWIFSLNDFHKRTMILNMREIVQAAFTAAGVTLPDNITVMAFRYNSAYYDVVGSLLHWAGTRTVHNLYAFEYYRRVAKNMNTNMTAFQNKFNAGINRNFEKSWWSEKFCLTYIKDLYQDTLASEYEKRWFPQSSKDDVLQILKLVKGRLWALINKSYHLLESRDEAKAKLKKLKVHIGRADDMLSDAELLELYGKLNITKTDHVRNLMGLRKLKKTRELQEQWRLYKFKYSLPHIQSAEYRAEANAIYISAAYLQEPVYHPDHSPAIKYGRVGYILGQLMQHMFVAEPDSQYDASGNHRDWYSPEDSRNFGRVLVCFVIRYEDYAHPIWKIRGNGDKTLWSNVGDVEGLRMAYRAFTVQYPNQQKLIIPGTGLTMEKAFFVGYAQHWCSVMSRAQVQATKGTIYEPYRFRMWGPIKNIETFGEIYQCPRDAPMNPRKWQKCFFWESPRSAFSVEKK